MTAAGQVATDGAGTRGVVRRVKQVVDTGVNVTEQVFVDWLVRGEQQLPMEVGE